ncbi:hypothetical protein TB2_028018 [Malus domestica]
MRVPSLNRVLPRNVKNVEDSLLPESAVVVVRRSYETHAVVLKLKAPQTNESKTASLGRRAPIDLVTVEEELYIPSAWMKRRAPRLAGLDQDHNSVCKYSEIYEKKIWGLCSRT